MESRTQGPARLIGQSVGNYRLERMLGKGATGAVFLGKRLDNSPRIIERTQALPIELPDEAAIKVLILPWQLEEDGQADFQARFLREAQTLQRLQHPHIVSVLDYGEDPVSGHTYMVLPYMAGGTLATHLSSGSMPLDGIASTLAQIAEALDYAHSLGVVHRDIKPGNILMDDQGQAYVADFSIARILAETHTRLTSTGRIMGTPEYMAPEQIDGRSVGAPADIYSLGMVVYQLVTGQVAFSATSIVELIRLQIQEPPPAPRTLRPDLPEPAEAAILCAMEKDPAKRFSSAAAFAQAFSLGLQGQWAEGLTRFLSLDAGGPPGDAAAQTLPNEFTTQPVVAAQRHNQLQMLALSLAAALLAACMVFAFALPNSPMWALLKPYAPAIAAGTGPQTSLAQATHTATARSHGSGAHPTATRVGSGGTGNTGNTGNPGNPGNPGNNGGGAQSTATPTPTSTSAPMPTNTPTPRPTPTNTPPPPPPPTYYETATDPSGSGTFTDYTNAGGQGPNRIGSLQKVQVSCRVIGWQRPGSPSGDYWWYRIAQSPWTNPQYYAYADNFFNDGTTTHNNVLVDTNVPIC